MDIFPGYTFLPRTSTLPNYIQKPSFQVHYMKNVLFSFFQDHLLFTNSDHTVCPPSVTIKWPDISRPSPEYNFPDSKNSVTSTVTGKSLETLVSPPSGLTFQDSSKYNSTDSKSCASQEASKVTMESLSPHIHHPTACHFKTISHA